jgi:hypothetical protein
MTRKNGLLTGHSRTVSSTAGIIGAAFSREKEKEAVIPVLCLHHLEGLWVLSHSRIKFSSRALWFTICTCMGRYGNRIWGKGLGGRQPYWALNVHSRCSRLGIGIISEAPLEGLGDL